MPKAEKEPIVEATRTTSHNKTTSGTLRWAEDTDDTVFRTIYIEKRFLPQDVKDNPEDYFVEVVVKVYKR
jgi:hypothetical protein